MSNQEFLEVIKKSFEKYLETGARSNEKLVILHGNIAKHLSEKLGKDYIIHSLGFDDSKEINMVGRYMDKKVDIGIEKNGEVIAAIALKFIMSNYSQNSNNYFENMLGETANIRSKGKPYFQIIIMPSKIPYFKKEGRISHYDSITAHNLSKYIKLSNDDVERYMHVPNKTLLYLVDFPINKETIARHDYYEYYRDNCDYHVKENKTVYEFGNSFIYNNYNKFIDQICDCILSISS